MNKCACGCGKETNVIKQTCRKDGRIKGEASKFLSGHNGKLNKNIDMIKNISKKGKDSQNWRGGEVVTGRGYVLRYNQYRKNGSEYIPLHILIAEKVLGYKLPNKAIVHHADGNPLNNEKDNLVICQSQGYHLLLHRRKRAFDAGSVKMLRCAICKKHDFPEKLYISPIGAGRHRECHAKYEFLRKKKELL